MRFFAPMAYLWKRIVRQRRYFRLLLIALGVFVSSLALAEPAQADVIQGFAKVIAAGEFILLYALGKIVVVAFDLIVQIAQYNDFLNAAAVEKGWVIVRDVANMFFIIVLLVIAFGTLFRIEKYRFNELLRKVIIMAVLVNFSKLITGIFIDLMQVIMLTFVNAFADTAAGNLTSSVGLRKFLALDPSKGEEVSHLAIAATLFLGVLMMAVLCVVTVVYAIVFLIRIIALWVLTILSPLAYLLSAFPDTQSYAQRWWKEFWKYASIGPILAFFLWLSLTITQVEGGKTSTLITGSTTASDPRFEAGEGAISAGISEISTSEGILSFLVSIILLVVSLSIATETGITIGSGLTKRTSEFLKQQGFRMFAGAATSPLRWGLTQKLARNVTAGLAGGIPTPWGRPVAIPWLSHRMMGLNVRLEQYKSKSKAAEYEKMKAIKNRYLISRLANPLLGRDTNPITGEAYGRRTKKFLKTFRRVSTKWRQEAFIEGFDPGANLDKNLMIDYLVEHAASTYDDLHPKRKRAFVNQLRQLGVDPAIHSQRFMRKIVNSNNDFDRDLWDLGELKFDPRLSSYYIPKKKIDPATGLVTGIDKTNLTPEGEFRLFNADNNQRLEDDGQPPRAPRVDAAGNIIDPRLKEQREPRWSYLMGLGAPRFEDTRQAMYDRFDGDPEKFFQSPEFQAGYASGAYLSEHEFKNAEHEANLLNRDISARRTFLGEPTLGEGAIERGERGETFVYYDDLTDQDYLAEGVHADAEGMHIATEEGKAQFARVAKRRYRDAEEKRRARELFENQTLLATYKDQFPQRDISGLNYHTLSDSQRNAMWRELDADHSLDASSSLVDPEFSAYGEEEMMKEVKADTAYQKRLNEKVDRLQSSMLNAGSISIENQRRVGTSAEEVELHEDAHNQVDNISNNTIEYMWNRLPAQRQREITTAYERRWGRLGPTNPDSVKREFFTHALATAGRSTVAIPEFTLNAETEAPILRELQSQGRASVTLRARAEVQNMSSDIRRAIWKGLPADHRTKAIHYVNKNILHVDHDNESDEGISEALSYMLASHRGGPKIANLQFLTEGEQETALFLHAQARGKLPKHKRGTAASVTEVAAPAVRVTTAPAGTARVTAPRPAAPEGPRIGSQQFVINQSLHDDTSVREEIQSLLSRLGQPSAATSEELRSGFSRLEEKLRTVGRQQHIQSDVLDTLAKRLRKTQEDLGAATDEEARGRVVQEFRTWIHPQPGGKSPEPPEQEQQPPAALAA